MISAETGMFFLAIGLIAGSTMGMLTYRLPLMITHEENPAKAGTALNLWFPGSHCCHCRQPLRWFDNIPLLSWLWLRGKCRYCGKRVSLRYLLSELICAIIAPLCYLLHPNDIGLALALFLYFWFALALCIIDLRHLLLPDKLTLPLIWCGLVFNACTGFIDCHDAILGAVAGYATLWLVNQIVRLAYRKEGIGYGDFKLFAATGAWSGWQSLPYILYIAAIAGIIYGLLAMLRARRRVSIIPFGPALALSGWGYFCWMSGS